MGWQHEARQRFIHAWAAEAPGWTQRDGWMGAVCFDAPHPPGRQAGLLIVTAGQVEEPFFGHRWHITKDTAALVAKVRAAMEREGQTGWREGSA